MKDKFLLLGGYVNNAGPCNVNRSLIENSDGSMSYIKTASLRKIHRLENILKVIFYSNIVFSGGVPLYEFKLCKLLHKRTFYLMHGCLRYECVVNKLILPKFTIEKEEFVFKNVHKIIAVSSKYAEWVKRNFPQYASKITYCTNSIQLIENQSISIQHTTTDKNRIIAVTGGNIPIKRNYYICKAVEKLNERGWNIRVDVFGRYHINGEAIYDFPFVKKMGQMNQKEYYEHLEKTDLLCINSDLESFGLVVCDALNCGCALLMSDNVGATCIFNSLKEEDIIINNYNIGEIAYKIEYLLTESNFSRLFHSVDREKYSAKSAFLRLKEICLHE